MYDVVLIWNLFECLHDDEIINDIYFCNYYIQIYIIKKWGKIIIKFIYINNLYPIFIIFKNQDVTNINSNLIKINK